MYTHLHDHDLLLQICSALTLLIACIVVFRRLFLANAEDKPDQPADQIPTLPTMSNRNDHAEFSQSVLAATRYELQRAREELVWLTGELQVSRDSATNAARTKSQFLSHMSHEIRTPLNGVIATTQLLLCTDLTDEQRDFVQIAQESATILLETVNDLLDFNMIENGDLCLDVMDFDIIMLVEGAAELVGQKAHEKNLSLMTFIATDVPQILYGDPTRLRQILTNLLSNAIKFSNSGEVTCKVELDCLIGQRAKLTFSITDTSTDRINMDPATLFEPFLQIDGNCTRDNAGIGLGLSIANRLVRLMGSEVHVDNESDQGTRFWFDLILEHAGTRTTPTVPPELSGLKLLLIDQLTGTREILQEYLQSWGMTCITADSGTDGLAMLTDSYTQNAPCDLVIVDQQIADLDPLKLAKYIKSDSVTGASELILLRASRYDEAGESALASGFDATLAKPIKQSQLYDCIAQVMNKKHGRNIDEADFPSADLATLDPSTKARRDSGQAPIILVVEDNSVNQRVARLQLQELGYRVDIVNNGREALYAIMSTKYDLVLMDCAMPIMDGYEATRHIRKHDAISGRHTIIVALTAHALAGDRERCIASGMDDYLSKPVNVQQLQTALKRWIKHHDVVSG